MKDGKLTLDDLKSMPEYSFLFEREELGDNLGLLCYGGSHAYGTNAEGSDHDIRGFSFLSAKRILLSDDFEQVRSASVDTTIYSFPKTLSLLSSCNPNVVEILGLREKDMLFVSPVMKEMIAEQNMFLSKQAAHTFGGYAVQQLTRLKNNLSRWSEDEVWKAEGIAQSLSRMLEEMPKRYKAFAVEGNPLKFYAEDGSIYVDMELKHFPVTEWASALADAKNTVKEFQKMGARNVKKDMAHLCKHQCHLIRLLDMGTEILEGKGVYANREGRGLELLMEIRAGKFMVSEDEVDDVFWDLLDEKQKAFEFAKENSPLPAKADDEKIQEFLLSVHSDIVKKSLLG